jgi:hypothetical protein
LGWGIDWLAHALLFDHGEYFTHSPSVADWGFPRGGPRAYPGRPAWGRGGDWGRSRGWGRDGDRYSWSHEGYGHAAVGYNRGPGQGFSRFDDARTSEGFNRGFPSRGSIYGRPVMPGPGNGQLPERGRGTEQIARQGFGYGSNSYGRERGSFGRAEGMFGNSRPSFGAPSRSFGSPHTNYQRGGSGGRGFEGYQSYNGRPQHSGGFHLFGGGHQSYSFGRGSFGGGHSGWGGSGFKAPRASHFGGGAHHFGGGGHSGSGSHFGGGHVGGHGGGGRHH